MPNNYETDLIYPIVAAAAKLAGLDYHSADARQQTATASRLLPLRLGLKLSRLLVLITMHCKCLIIDVSVAGDG